LAEVAEKFGLTEDAARMRVNRALDNVRRQLAIAGIEDRSVLADLLVGCRSEVPSRLTEWILGDSKVLPRHLSKLTGGPTMPLSTAPLAAAIALLTVGAGTSAVILHSSKPIPRASAVSAVATVLPAPQVADPADPVPDQISTLTELKNDLMGSWQVSLGAQDHGKSTNLTFPRATIKLDKATGKLLLRAKSQTSDESGALDADWRIEPATGRLEILTDPTPKYAPLKLTSITRQPTIRLLTFAGRSSTANYQVTVKFGHETIEFVIDGAKFDGSKLQPERATITLVRLRP
jgi:hypothetical protein